MGENPKIEIKTKYGTAVLFLHSATSAYVEGGTEATPWNINNIDVRGYVHLEKTDGSTEGPGNIWNLPGGSWPSLKRVGVDWQKSDLISGNLSRKWRETVLDAVREWGKTGAAAETRAEAVSLEDSAQHDEEKAAELETEARDLRQKAAKSRKKAADLGAAPGFLFENVKTSGGAGS